MRSLLFVLLFAVVLNLPLPAQQAAPAQQPPAAMGQGGDVFVPLAPASLSRQRRGPMATTSR